jgi:signal transduction histidine kinase
VSNILNVARIENDQLELALQDCEWGSTLENIVEGLKLRAQVRGITLECKIEDNLPHVGADRVSIYEVVSNLVDNAIKYSGESKRILITAAQKDGLVETTVQDWGVGIAESVIPHLFNKFSRNFHNQSQIGGTGLGLYLCKSIVAAHGGNIWVRSKEGQGATFGFTLLPYDQVANQQKNSDNKGIVRGAHGWIKNHSLYRR